MTPKRILILIVILLAGLALACGNATPSAVQPTVAAPTDAPVEVATPTTPVEAEPAFGLIGFGLGIVNDTDIVRARSAFPEGVYKVYASFDYTDMPAGIEWRREWLYNGQLVEAISLTEAWPHDKHGTTWLNAFNEEGLSPGAWELRLYIAGKLVRQDGFEVAERRPDQPAFLPITFAKGATDAFEAIDPGEQFSKVSEIHGIFKAQGLEQGMTFDRVWYFNGDEVLRNTETVEDATIDTYDASLFVDQGALDLGTYTLEIEYDGDLMQGGSFLVVE